jgi:hypothetical protein
MIQRHMHLKIVCFLHHYVQNFNNTWPLQQVQNCLRFFAIIAQNKTINSRPKCRVLVYQLVIVVTKQDNLIGLPTNCPYFPGHPIFQPICPTSLLWPIYAPQCIMSQFFSRDGKSQFKSQAEINCFLLTFIISVKKKQKFRRQKDEITKTYLACQNALELTDHPQQYAILKIFSGNINPCKEGRV